MDIPLPPMLCAWDSMDLTWAYWAQFGKRASDWLRDHGINPDTAHRVEFYLMDEPFARVFAYDVCDDGCVIVLPDGEPARLEPQIVMLAELPPADLLTY